MGLHHHHDGEDEEEHHSIASLRSKFESLAHGDLHREQGQVSAPMRAAGRLPSSTPPPSGLAGRPLSPASGAQFSGATISTSSSSGVSHLL